MLTLNVSQARITEIHLPIVDNKNYTCSLIYTLTVLDNKGNITTLLSKSISVIYPLTTAVPTMAAMAAQVKADVLSYWSATVDSVYIGGTSY